MDIEIKWYHETAKCLKIKSSTSRGNRKRVKVPTCKVLYHKCSCFNNNYFVIFLGRVAQYARRVSEAVQTF